MDIEIYSLLATSILLISLATIVFSIYSYVLFRVREGRKLKKTAGHGHASPEPAPVEQAAEEPERAAIDERVLEAGLARLAAAAGASVSPSPAADPPKVSSGSGRFFKPYDPGSSQ